MKLLLIILLNFLVIICVAQIETAKIKKTQFFSVSANYSYGNVIPTTDFVKGDNLSGKPISNFQSVTIKALFQNPGYTDWQKVYRMPYYGFGSSLGNFFNIEEVGLPVSHYGVLGIPVFRFNKFELYSEFQFGITWNWKKYDPLLNPKNLVIGGGLTVHSNAGIYALCHMTKNFDLGTGLSFTHFSNGGFERPNRGFNIYSPSLELKYHFSKRPDANSVKPPGRLKRSDDLYLMLGYGDHQLNEHELDTNYFAVAGMSIIYFKQFSNAFRLGIGSDINYWMGLTALPDGTMGPRNFNNLTVGFIVQPEFIIDRLSLVSGFGIYTKHLNYGDFKQTYQRLGIRYEFYKNFSAGINIRAINFMLAEFLEFNFGYRFKRAK